MNTRVSTDVNVQRWVALAFRESLKGRPKSQRVGAVLLRGGNVIEKAFNISRPYGEANCSLHAEERLLKGKTFTGCTLVVVRSNKQGKLVTMSRPCEHKCYELVVRAKIRKIIYINWEGEIVIEKVKLLN